MSVNPLEKLAAEISDLPIKNADGSPWLDENGDPVTATVFGPGTKIWRVANDLRHRKSIKRTREAKGKWEAAVDNSVEDDIEFLCTVTKRFNGMQMPDVDGDKANVEAIYNHPLLGYIRDHMVEDTKNWENFMKASRTNSPSTLGSTAG